MIAYLKILTYLMVPLFIFSGCSTSTRQPEKIVVKNRVTRLPIFKPPNEKVKLNIKVRGNKVIVDKDKFTLLLKNCDIYKRNSISYEHINRKINKANGYDR